MSNLYQSDNTQTRNGQPYRKLSDWTVTVVSKDLVRVGCTEVTREEIEGILAKMRELDGPSCWRDLEKVTTQAQFTAAVVSCLYDLREAVRELQKK